MVARHDERIGSLQPLAALASGVFLWWRKILTRVSHGFMSRTSSRVREKVAGALRSGARLLNSGCATACLWWRAVLTRSFRRLQSAVRWPSLRSAIARTLRSWVRPSSASEIAEHGLWTAIVLAVLVLVAATAASGLVGLHTGPGLWGYALGLVVWSIARLALLVALAFTARIGVRHATAAWAIALPPLALGALPGLGFVAFLISAAVARSALEGVGAARADATRLVLLAYGAQALASGAAMLASALLAR